MDSSSVTVSSHAGGLCAAVGIELRTAENRWDVVLAAPGRRNAQTPATWRALAAVGAAVAEAAPRVVVLSATGPAFSAGLDRAMFTGTSPGEPGLPQLAALADDDLDAVIASYQDGFTWWRDGDAITIAAVQGHAVGAGFQLALGCDLRVVANDVAFAMRETSLGLVPDLAVPGRSSTRSATPGRWRSASADGPSVPPRPWRQGSRWPPCPRRACQRPSTSSWRPWSPHRRLPPRRPSGCWRAPRTGRRESSTPPSDSPSATGCATSRA